MAKLPTLTAKDLESARLRQGFEAVRQKESHVRKEKETAILIDPAIQKILNCINFKGQVGS
jgi:predicted RNA binding protein YcfA (HicA-like mRNA interferase family)